MKLDGNRLGLTLGILIAGMHVAWLILVAVGVSTAKSVYDWILALRHLRISYVVTPFNIGAVIFLVIITFVTALPLRHSCRSTLGCVKGKVSAINL